jgi:hypothetical protein
VNNNPTEDVTVKILRNDYAKGNEEKIQNLYCGMRGAKLSRKTGKKN